MLVYVILLAVVGVPGLYTAQDAFGQPLPVAATESRLVANRDLFHFNGKRLLRAGGAGTDGTLVYDAPGSINWTATYTGLDAADMDRILGTGGLPGSEFRGMWLGRDPLALTESTIYENGDGISGGPAAAVCAAPAERATPLVRFDKPGLTFADQAVGTAGTTQTIRLFNVGTAPMTIDAMALVGPNATDFTLSANTCPTSPATLAVGANCSLSVIFTPSAAGPRPRERGGQGPPATGSTSTGHGDPLSPTRPSSFSEMGAANRGAHLRVELRPPIEWAAPGARSPGRAAACRAGPPVEAVRRCPHPPAGGEGRLLRTPVGCRARR